MQTEKLEMDEELGDTKSRGYFCSTGQIVFLLVFAAGLIAAVGCMSYYLPDRSCVEAVTAEPKPTENPPTPPPVTEPQPTEPGPTPTEGEWPGRLPRNLMPNNYQLYLKPYLYDDDLGPGDRRFTFDGRVKIVMDCVAPTNVITLHINNITLRSYSLEDKSGNVYVISSLTTNREYQFLHFNLEEMLEAGTSYVLDIEYLGELWGGLSGFYRSSYEDAEGNTKWLATTQMEPTGARRALPCFDEPDMKAIFYTTIEHRPYMTALTNGKEDGPPVVVDEMWSKTSFVAMPKMPTYLLAFVVSEFAFSEEFSAETDVRTRIWSRPQWVDETEYALDNGVKILDYFESNLGIPFPLPKSDHIAIPDFAAGAMENWGLVTYREIYLLYDARVNSANQKQDIVAVIAHELAHMWFGDLVSPVWWSELWLNEGFASYYEWVGTDFVEPTFGMMEQILIDIHRVMDTDALGTSHPIRKPVNTPAEINGMFDSITYTKGSALNRMMHSFLGDEVWVSGLNYYLNVHKFGNTQSEDLWFALTQADEGHGNLDVSKIMDTWTLQMGYPLVDIQRIDRNTINATQTHFLLNPEGGVTDRWGDLGYLWYVYLTLTHKSNINFEAPQAEWFNAERWAIFTLEDSIANDDWFIANIREEGYFRVNYDVENWNKLSEQLVADHKVFPNENRAQLINDAFILAGVERVSYPLAFDVTRYLDAELDYIPWEATLRQMSYIRDMFILTPDYGMFERYMRKQIDALYIELGWDDDQVTDPHLEQRNRINAVGTACRYRNQDCLDQATAVYAEYMENDANNLDEKPDYEINPITPNLKDTAYCYGIQEGGETEWDFGWKKYREATNSNELYKWLRALSCSNQPWILKRYLDYALDTEVVRVQDASYVINYVAANPVGRTIAWDFVRNEFDTLFEYYGDTMMGFSAIISDVTEDFNTEIELYELIKFGEDHDLGSATGAHEQAVEQTETNIAWMEANADKIATWLEENAPPL